MMEVTQNVELKELSTGEEKLLQSIVSELNHKVDDANPEKEATIKRNNAIVVKEICNGLDVKDSENDIDSSTHLNSIDKHSDRGSSTERDAGSDLDALLDKITSIVDGDPKESAEEERKQSSLAIKTVEDIDHEKIADPANDCTEPEMIDGIKANKVEVHSNCVQEAKDAKLVATGKEILEGSDQKTLNNTDICGTKAAVIVSDAEKTAEIKNNINAAEVLNADEIDPVATTPILNNSNDELFLDALDNISSSDEFEVLAENNPKIEKESVEKECKNGAVDIALENISSSDEYEVLAENNPKIEKESVEKECKHGAVDITSEDSNDKVIPCMEKTREEVSIIDLDTSEECLTETQDSEMTKKPAAHKKSDVGKTEESNSKEKIVQEMNDKSTDKICAEAIESSESCTKETKHEEEANEKESEDSVEANKNILGTSTTEPKQTLEKESMPTDGLSNPNDQKLDKKDPDSDDEVIFFEPIKKLEETTIADKGKECKVIKPSSETDKKENAVVLLSEDEEDDLPTAEQPAKELSKNLHKTEDQTNGFIGVDLSADNSDNACDQFEKVKSREKAKVNTIDDVNSNSSNLLQPSQKSRGECIPVADTDADAEPAANPEPEADPNVELEDDNEDMVVEETEYEQHAIPPAVKRIRLSTDHKTETSNTSSCTTNDTCSTTATTITTNDEEVQQTVGKRSHSLLSTNSPESQKEETPSKKLKADDSDSNSSIDGTLQIDLDAHEQTKLETETSVLDVKTSEPAADLDIPIELKPTPELKCDVKPLRLEFVKSFRKSFDKMTRYDLEELVLQKVVESMLVKSEFAEIRRQVDNHEVTLSNYRRKIAEVSKQYLDLETVHKRVLKDLETKNAHFTAPVRITRAVGLQVGMTLMKKPSEESRTHHTAGSMPAPSQAIGSSSSPSTMQTPPKASTSPLRSTMRPGRPITRPQPNTEQQQNLQHQAQIARSTIPFAQASASSNSSPVRRGCMQKVTPQRPVNNHASQTVFNQSVQQQRMQASQTLQSQRTPMFVSKHTTVSTSPAATVVPAAASAMRQRGPSAKPGTYSSMTHKLQQQQQQQQQQPLPVRIGRSPAKQQQSAVSVTSKQRLMPIGGGTVSVPMLNAQESGAGAAGYGQPSLAPARPKEKAVIDLTDEDDAAAAAAAAVLAAAEASARLRPPNATVKRSMQSTPISGARPVAGSVVRVSPMNMPRANAVARQIVSNNGSGQRGSLGSNIPLHTTRSENTPPSGSRSRLSHPAPLPLAPAQTFHPDWKLPPSRPIIRISLHETGIVISWTLEDTGSRFAECVTYQIYAYQETINEPSTDSWRHVGDVKAMLLPMAVTLNQFQENQRYFFAVRGVDAHERYGVFSLPKTW